jgi:hypothetical protein
MREHRYGMRLSKLGANALFIILCVSCLEPFTFRADSTPGLVVISGQVSNLVDRNIIQIGTTTNTLQVPIPYSGAFVQAIDEQGNAITYSEQTKKGVYFGNVAGEPGRTYYLRVQLGDKVYESATEKMPLSAGTIDASYEFSTHQVVDGEGTARIVANIEIYGDSELPPDDEANYFRWNTEEVYVIIPTDFPDVFGTVPPNCYVTKPVDAQRVTLYNGDEVSGKSIERQFLLTRPIDQSFHARHAFTVFQSAITRETHEYWRKVNILANQVGSIFDSPPAKLSGNIRNVSDDNENVLGYFQATNQTFSRVFLFASDLPVTLPRYCDFDLNRSYGDYPQECLNCLSANGSSYTKPEWF